MKKIKILKNGPYEVSGNVPLKDAVIGTDMMGISTKWEEGKTHEELPEPYHLCRCGHSKNMPFCDGTHAKIGFRGEETSDNAPYAEAAVRYEGETVDILDNECLCASLRFCDRGARAWEAAIRSGDPANRKLAIEEACDCAAGRLTVVEKDGTPHEPELPQEVSPITDPAANCRGPLWVKGGIEVEGAEGTQYEVRNRVTLCRCGQSRNMPFCDTSHRMCAHMKLS